MIRGLITHSGGSLCVIKKQDFHNQSNNKFEGEPRAKAEYASKRADGTINTHPQERMRASSNRDSDTSELF